ncbi:MAG: hypothetical protein M1815_005034 [Lichina confinis]|nr:MAG: hypothetical protein M1815_005034 [Lichina confinis]
MWCSPKKEDLASAGGYDERLYTRPSPGSTPKQQEGDVGAKSAEMLPTAKVPDGQEAVVSQPAAAITGDTNSVFIPLLPPLKFDQPEYNVETPEVMSIIALFNDVKRQTKLKRALSDDIGYQLFKSKHRRVQALGRPVQVDQYWFEFDFPVGPPPIYVVRGIEIIGPDVYWTRKEMTPDKMARFQQAVWPKAVFRSTVAGFKTLFHLNEQRVRSYLGNEGAKDARTEEQDQERKAGPGAKQQAAKARIQTKPGPGKQKIPSASTTGPSPPPSPSSPSSSPSPSPSPSPPASASASADKAMPADPGARGPLSSSATTARKSPEKNETSNGSRETIKTLQKDIKISLSLAKRHLAQTWINPITPRPPDAVEINGEIQLAGPRGTLTVVVRGFYYPAKSQWGRLEAVIRPPKIFDLSGGSNE